ncbi:MAG: ribbon-helix-helix domain-containing protein [Anaerolineae bacterium]|nr:ribbon-helix-helix domain-containing protein [Anaerolineae bacterium]MCO5204911.1 ribbon-helix-helix domain-containing protein [Anaerolineae bacterium]
MSAKLGQFETVRTTVTIPANLLKRSQHFVDAGEVPNRNTLIVAALERLLEEMGRAEIDRAFYASADDAAYRPHNQRGAIRTYSVLTAPLQLPHTRRVWFMHC